MLLTEANLTLDAFLILPDGLATNVTFKARGYPVCTIPEVLCLLPALCIPEPHFAGPGFSEISPERIKT